MKLALVLLIMFSHFSAKANGTGLQKFFSSIKMSSQNSEDLLKFIEYFTDYELTTAEILISEIKHLNQLHSQLQKPLSSELDNKSMEFQLNEDLVHDLDLQKDLLEVSLQKLLSI